MEHSLCKIFFHIVGIISALETSIYHSLCNVALQHQLESENQNRPAFLLRILYNTVREKISEISRYSKLQISCFTAYFCLYIFGVGPYYFFSGCPYENTPTNKNEYLF